MRDDLTYTASSNMKHRCVFVDPPVKMNGPRSPGTGVLRSGELRCALDECSCAPYPAVAACSHDIQTLGTRTVTAFCAIAGVGLLGGLIAPTPAHA
jgi:hypothetical protein